METAGNSTASRPLVSVIVRTLGRDTLPSTIYGIERQTWRPIEVVLVLAREMAPPLLTTSLALRVVGGERPLSRPAAANAGLETAKGEWMLFLDEDDFIEREHIALLHAAATRAGLPVAYSQTRLVDAGGQQRLMGGPYRREFLMQSNFLAIHAVLFHRRFVDAGARFDESYDMFEDWDFWLHLAQRTDFAFVMRPTAVYRIDIGASGAGGGRNLDRAAALRSREHIVRKWHLR